MAVDTKTSWKEILNVYKRRVRHWPVLPDEMVFEILVRLPVKSLRRFKSVSKAWRATIFDPSFIRSHLQQSAKSHREQKNSYLITPITLEDKVIDSEAWPTNVSNRISFYSWQEGQGEARHVHSATFHAEFGSVYDMLHYDGIVLLSTDTKLYVLNPATHDVLKLPDGQEDVSGIPNLGFGLDPRTKKYKVVRFFYRHRDFSMRTYGVGMEIFTIDGDDDIDSSWSVTEDPPLPIGPGAATHIEGSLYLFVRDDLVERPSQGFLRFNLEDEAFSFISHPEIFSPKEEHLSFIELGGESCLAQGFDGKQVIWMLLQSGEWARHYVVILPEPRYFEILSVLPKDVLLIRSGNWLYHYDNARQNVREVVCLDRLRYKKHRVGSFDFVGREDVFMFSMLSYMESLLPVTKRRQHLAMYPNTAGARMSDEQQPGGRRLCLTTVVTEASSEPMQRKSKRKKREAQHYCITQATTGSSDTLIMKCSRPGIYTN